MGIRITFNGELEFSSSPTKEQIDEFCEYVKQTFEEPPTPELKYSRYCEWRMSLMWSKPTLICQEVSDLDEAILWLEHLVEKFFKPWGIQLNGSLETDDSIGDRNFVMVTDNQVTREYAVSVGQTELRRLEFFIEQLADNHPDTYHLIKQRWEEKNS